ncbi:MAG TPA: VOC family protein [Candidatus Binatia bacterium]|nr:VOC family protein [Candidatus Binatia bacterium]
MIKVSDLAYVRFRAPDLDRAEAFLTDFGLVRAARTASALYMRGSDAFHHVHVTELGEPAFVGVGLRAESVADLEAIARAPGAGPVEPIDEPGGGLRVRLVDPNGIALEVVHGMEGVSALPLPARRPRNDGATRARRGEPQSVERGPSHVKRLGHFVLLVNDFRETEAFYRDRFGFLSSDEVYLGDRDQVLAAFMRCDRGAEYVDHHTFLAIGAGQVALNHVSFEVHDLDDLMAGHEHLAARGHAHHWGVGRHVVGSQVFDYWRDPWGNVHEHWTDGDLFDATSPTGAIAIGGPGPESHWGPPAPSPFGA